MLSKKVLVAGLVMLVLGIGLDLNFLVSHFNRAEIAEVELSNNSLSTVKSSIGLPINLKRTKTKKFIALKNIKAIKLKGEVTSASVIPILNFIRENQDGGQPILLVIDSPGGSVFAGNKVIALIKASQVPVITLISGMAASMGAHIHQAGHLRLMAEGSFLMFHPISGGTQGTIYEMNSQLDFIKRVEAQMDSYVAKRAGISEEVFTQKVLENLWLDADSAYKSNFIEGYSADTQLDIPEVSIPFFNREKTNTEVAVDPSHEVGKPVFTTIWK